MKKVAIVLAFMAMALLLGFSGARAAEITASGITRLPDYQKLIVGKWTFVGETKKGALVKAVTTLEPDGQAMFSITGYKFGFPVTQEFSGRYSVGELNNKPYLFLNLFEKDEKEWITVEIISLEPERIRLKGISDSSNSSFISNAVLWQKIAVPAD